ncbi:MAG: hypothetical protein MUF00_15155 [Gemmatimonadaceae bacterium]|jgi:hypothetical protein|nr:hypothetical protein [Gemmatimonadaceae bacterium]
MPARRTRLPLRGPRSVVAATLSAATLGIAVVGLAACAESPLAPAVEPTSPPPAVTPVPPVARPGDDSLPGSALGTIRRSQLRLTGDVTQSATEARVRGAVGITIAGRTIEFVDADLLLEFTPDGGLRRMRGTALVPSPTERLQIAEPVRADVAFMSGRDLNATGLVPIPLNEQRDYFLFRVAARLQLGIATGPSDVTPLVFTPRPGGEVVFVLDLFDPMYYVHGEYDKLGVAMGIGWSMQNRIPFVPELRVEEFGPFFGGTTRTGTFPVKKILSITGQIVENQTTEVHLTTSDPLSSSLRSDYRMGFNGAASLHLDLKYAWSLEIPLARASGGLRRTLSTSDGFSGNVWVRGATDPASDWWPTVLPVRPTSGLTTQAFLTTQGDFTVQMAGEYGWQLPFGRSAMVGAFDVSPRGMQVRGTVVAGRDSLSLVGSVTEAATAIGMQPPSWMGNAMRNATMQQVDARLASARAALAHYERETANYELELSLRGLRSGIPAMARTVRNLVTLTIDNAADAHRGTPYHRALSDHLRDVAAPHLQRLDQLAARAADMRDNDQTRRELESALRAVLANPRFETTYRAKAGPITIKTVHISRTILTEAQQTQLRRAADNVRHIKPASDRMIAARTLWTSFPSEAVFAEVRAQIERGTAILPAVTEYGFTIQHRGSGGFSLYVIMNGTRHELGLIDPFDPQAVLDAAAARVTDGLGV